MLEGRKGEGRKDQRLEDPSGLSPSRLSAFSLVFPPFRFSAFPPFYYLISMAKPTFYTKPT